VRNLFDKSAVVAGFVIVSIQIKSRDLSVDAALK
jgi:hypothetical protein